MLATFIGTSTGMIASNFIYQIFRVVPDWNAAFERSFFQTVALGCVGAALALRSIAH